MKRDGFQPSYIQGTVPEVILRFLATGKNFTWLNIRHPVDIQMEIWGV